MEKTAQHLLSHYYGYPSFRKNQQEVIDTLLAGQDAFVLMPMMNEGRAAVTIYNNKLRG